MTTQLTLLPAATSPWRLDPRTRAIGQQGLAAARAALAASAPHGTDPFRRTAPGAAAGDPALTPAAAAA